MKNLKKNVNILLFIYTARSRTYVLNGPGAIVKKITYEKSVDFSSKIIIIISVKGRATLIILATL